MKWKVLVSAPYMTSVIDRFRPLLESHHIEIMIPLVNERLSEDELLKYIGDLDGVICGDDRFTEKVFQAAPRLKVISKWGTGIDSIDQEAAAKHGVKVRNTPNAFTEPVADSVLGYILSFARQLPWMNEDLRSGKWVKRPSVALNECTLGVVGVGNIGKGVIRRARAFGMRVLGHDILEVDQAFLEQNAVVMVERERLLKEADFVSLNCDLNPTSYHLMGAREFTQMRPTAYLINTARGSIADEEALVEALRTGQIAGAGLDVFEREPLPPESPLLKFQNVLLAPHNANASPAAWERVHVNTLRNLFEALGIVDSCLELSRISELH